MKTVSLVVEITEAAAEKLEELQETGLYGFDVEETARELLLLGLRSEVLNQPLELIEEASE